MVLMQHVQRLGLLIVTGGGVFPDSDAFNKFLGSFLQEQPSAWVLTFHFPQGLQDRGHQPQ